VSRLFDSLSSTSRLGFVLTRTILLTTVLSTSAAKARRSWAIFIALGQRHLSRLLVKVRDRYLGSTALLVMYLRMVLRDKPVRRDISRMPIPFLRC
jgi:hypothetical protein